MGSAGADPDPDPAVEQQTSNCPVCWFMQGWKRKRKSLFIRLIILCFFPHQEIPPPLLLRRSEIYPVVDHDRVLVAEEVAHALGPGGALRLDRVGL